MKLPVPCVVCGRELEGVDSPGWEVNQPWAGTAFITHGHYGSTIYDPMSLTEYLEINVCDPCMRDLAGRGRILKATIGPEHPTYEDWNPDD